MDYLRGWVTPVLIAKLIKTTYVTHGAQHGWLNGTKSNWMRLWRMARPVQIPSCLGILVTVVHGAHWILGMATKTLDHPVPQFSSICQIGLYCSYSSIRLGCNTIAAAMLSVFLLGVKLGSGALILFSLVSTCVSFCRVRQRPLTL